MVSQAIILAAGKGSRLSKYTTNVPKALLPIKYGETIIERMVNQLNPIMSLAKCGNLLNTIQAYKRISWDFSTNA